MGSLALRLAEGGEWEQAAIHLAHSMVAYATAFLLWILFLLVFLPSSPHFEAIDQLVSAIFLSGVGVEAYWGTSNLLRFVWRAKLSRLRKLLFYELIILLDALLLAPPSYALSPTLGDAVTLSAVVMGAIALLTHIDVVLELALRLQRRSYEAPGY